MDFIALWLIAIVLSLIAGVIDVVVLVVRYRRGDFKVGLSPELKRFKKAEFRTSTNSYAGTLTIWLLVIIFLIPCSLAFVILISLQILMGDATFVLASMLTVLLMSFIFFAIRDSITIIRRWPRCPKHDKRLKITGREVKGITQLLTFRCPEGDANVKMLSKINPGAGISARYGRGFRGGGPDSFGGGASGGGGAGR